MPPPRFTQSPLSGAVLSARGEGRAVLLRARRGAVGSARGDRGRLRAGSSTRPSIGLSVAFLPERARYADNENSASCGDPRLKRRVRGLWTRYQGHLIVGILGSLIATGIVAIVTGLITFPDAISGESDSTEKTIADGDAGRRLPPPPDRDRDGVLDRDDECPDEAADTRDGCPADADNDGVQDPDDLCPSLYGDDVDGCPKPRRQTVGLDDLREAEDVEFSVDASYDGTNINGQDYSDAVTGAVYGDGSGFGRLTITTKRRFDQVRFVVGISAEAECQRRCPAPGSDRTLDKT